MNVPAKTEPKPMLLDFMAQKYGLHPEEFAATVRKTCGLPNATPEEFAAFVLIARDLDLNPILREIHAFPKRGGGIVPVVGIDGWLKLINKQSTCDGWEFINHDDASGALFAITCRMYRKDRSHPVEVTEYLEECYRPTDAWKMRHRMLRHKALIQAGRYAFAFGGIYDEDEARVIAEGSAVDITPPKVKQLPPKPPAKSALGAEPPVSSVTKMTPPKPPVKTNVTDWAQEVKQQADAEIIDAETGEVLAPGELLTELDDALGTANNPVQIEEIWNDYDVEARLQTMPQGDEFVGVALGIKRRHMKRFE